MYVRSDTDKLKTVVYRKQNSLYLKVNELDLKKTEHQRLLAEQVCLLSYNVVFYKWPIMLDETTVHKRNKRCQEWIFSF